MLMLILDKYEVIMFSDECIVMTIHLLLFLCFASYQDLRIAPPLAPVTGYMFGKGVHLQIQCPKSANYTVTNSIGGF